MTGFFSGLTLKRLPLVLMMARCMHVGSQKMTVLAHGQAVQAIPAQNERPLVHLRRTTDW